MIDIRTGKELNDTYLHGADKVQITRRDFLSVGIAAASAVALAGSANASVRHGLGARLAANFCAEKGEYEFYNYLESSGTQIIKTNWRPKISSSLVAGVELVSTGNGARIFGVVQSSVVFQCTTYAGKIYLQCASSDTIASCANVPTDKSFHLYSAKAGAQSIDSSNGIQSGIGVDATNPMWIFERNGPNRSPAAMRLYSFKGYDDGVLVIDLYPVKRIVDNAIGLLDKANNVFYQNEGTGDFILG